MNKAAKIIVTIVTVLSVVLLVSIFLLSDRFLNDNANQINYVGGENEVSVNIHVPKEALVYDGTDKFDMRKDITATDETGKDITALINASVTSGAAAADKTIVYSINSPAYRFATAKRKLTLKNYGSPEIKVAKANITVDRTELPALVQTLIDNKQLNAKDGYGHDITNGIYIENINEISLAGEQTLVFAVTNFLNDTARVEKQVQVTDDIAPISVIALTTPTVSIPVGSAFDPFSYIQSARDSSGYDYLDQIKIEGTVDTSTVGQYTITYYIPSETGEPLYPATLTVVVTA